MKKTDDDLDAALIFPGPVAVVAGPGSGKTTVLAKRIKHLVEELKEHPEGIAVITFTREAARNMKERLTPPAKEGMPDVALPLERHPQTICTMHSLGARIIAQNCDRLGITSGYRVVSAWQIRQMLFEDAARLCGEDTAFGRECDKRKQQVGTPKDERQEQVFGAYQRILRSCNAIDYDDQIIMACQVLSDHDDVREEWQKRAAHLLVDEYQDINRPQLELIQLLSGPDAAGLFVVGDDDQSIYGFRGAEPGYIRGFAEHFDGGQIVSIPDCFRCQPHVIKAAHGFIQTFNPDRIEKPEPRCIRPEGPKVIVHGVPSDAREAVIIAAMAADALREGDVLVLLPKFGYSDQLENELRKRGIAFDAPSRPSSAANLIFAALRDWLKDPSDNLAFRELLQAVALGGMLGIPGPRARTPEKIALREEALTKLSELWNGVFDGASLKDSLGAFAQTDGLCANLDAVANELALATEGSPTDLGQRTFEALKPWVNAKSMLEELATAPAGPQGPNDGDANLVRIMTMRNSKGLEAETVMIIGLEEGSFPNGNHGTDQFEEEARLLYVSITRAKKELHLFHARTRSGGKTHQARSFSLKPSPFVGGLPDEHKEVRYHPSAAQRAAKK
jgi:DNA helicase-2/ATP-dependent DNA helicase PcrA